MLIVVNAVELCGDQKGYSQLSLVCVESSFAHKPNDKDFINRFQMTKRSTRVQLERLLRLQELVCEKCWLHQRAQQNTHREFSSLSSLLRCCELPQLR